MKHLQLYKALYGDEAMVPKHHFALHLWFMLRTFGTLISCLTMERLHKISKRMVKNRANTRSYELGCIEDVTIKQLHDRCEEWMEVDVLVGGSIPRSTSLLFRMLRELHPDGDCPTVARAIATRCGQVACEDVVFYEVDGLPRQCGQVKLHYAVAGVTYSFIEAWRKTAVAHLSEDAERYRVVANPARYRSSSILAALTFSAVEGYATVLVPPLYR